MRDYLEEGKDLEQAFKKKGCVPLSGFTLVEMVNLYLEEFDEFGYLDDPEIERMCTMNVVDSSTPTVTNKIVLSDDQQVAWDKLVNWVLNDEPYFILRGYAGTGKSFLIQKLADFNIKILYSAPTNKASKVLSNYVKEEAKTTYSILGLRMEQQEDKLVLVSARETPKLPENSILVIDEASMVGVELKDAIDKTRVKCKIKILFVGDPLQLPPVNEARGSAWNVTKKDSCKHTLRQVMRFDNQLLVLATRLRKCIKDKNWVSPISSDHSETEGVWEYRTQKQFENQVLKNITCTTDCIDTKIIAWRNKTVDYYNELIRDHFGFKKTFCERDLLLLAEPIEKDERIIAHTDEEFVVQSISEGSTVVDILGTEIPTWVLSVKGDRNLVLTVAKDQSRLNSYLTQKADHAKRQKDPFRKAAWKEFWRVKSLFNKVRYGYALTAHRAQGSTYKKVYIDTDDILTNRNNSEAFRCLYVACTRASDSLYTF
jgi:exodeoxyribonuclease-5